MSGKQLRLKRIVSPADGRAVIFPLDHGVTCGPIPGMERPAATVEAGIRGGADALVLHKGMLHCLESASGPLPGIIMHLSASTNLGPDPCRKVLVGGVEEALRLGADAVSVHINLGGAGEPEMLKDLGRVGRSCAEWQMPLLVMAYVRGDRVIAPVSGEQIAHAARIAAELGADLIKLPFPGDFQVLERICSSLPVPVVVAGGTPGDLGQILERTQRSLESGARGVAAGRNVFQRANPTGVLRAICGIVHRGITAKEALESLRSESEK
ncbi:MAG: 2-amino-3,7-dideoxy-D-threo-hept-6-ulosonate synthase [Syntrophobacteraceae bacterium]